MYSIRKCPNFNSFACGYLVLPLLWPPHAKSWLIGKDPWCWEGLGAGEGDDRGWDGWMASPTWWTWVWVNSRSWWWTGRPGVLGFMGCKESDTTEQLNWTELNWSDLALPTLFIEETVLFPLNILDFLSQINWPCMHGFLSELSALFHCSICLFLYLYHNVLITIALLYINSLKSGRMVLQLWSSFSRLLWLFSLWFPH